MFVLFWPSTGSEVTLEPPGCSRGLLKKSRMQDFRFQETVLVEIVLLFVQLLLLLLVLLLVLL